MQHVDEMRPRVHPIIDIKSIRPGTFFVRPAIPTLWHEIEKRCSERSLECYPAFPVGLTTRIANRERVALYFTLIKRHWLSRKENLFWAGATGGLFDGLVDFT